MLIHKTDILKESFLKPYIKSRREKHIQDSVNIETYSFDQTLIKNNHGPIR